MMVLLEGRLVARRAAAEGEDLDQADLAQDVEGPVDRAEADARLLAPDTLEDRFSRKVPPVVEGAQDGGALLGQAIASLQETGVHGLQVHSGPS